MLTIHLLDVIYIHVFTVYPCVSDPSPLLDPNDPLSRMDYDEYDANIFTSRPTTASTTFRKTYSFNEDIVDGPESVS